MYRLTLSPPYALATLIAAVAAELGVPAAALGTGACALKYEDDEGDEVTVSSDEGLADAVALGAACGWRALKLRLSRAVDSGDGSHAAAAAGAGVPGAGPAAVAMPAVASERGGARASAGGDGTTTFALALAALAVLGVGGFLAMRRHA